MTSKTISGIKLNCRHDTCDESVATTCIILDEYRINALAKSGEIFVDLGAYCGHASLLAASLGMVCIAVEPLPENVETIYKNIALNRFGVKISVIPKAISGKSGETVSFLLYDNDNHTHRFIGNINNTTGKTKHSVETVSLDDLLSPINSVHLVKTDCEGSEWEAFAAASEKTLLKIKHIVGEFHTIDNRTYDDFMKLFPMFTDISSSLQYKHSKGLRLFALRNNLQ